MKPATVTVTFRVQTEGKDAHVTTATWNNCDEGQVLFLEKHIIGALQTLQAEATKNLPAAVPVG